MTLFPWKIVSDLVTNLSSRPERSVVERSAVFLGLGERGHPLQNQRPWWGRTDPASVKSTNQEEFFELIQLSELRAIAITLPEVEEGPLVHAARRIAAFKVAGKSFVGVEKGGVTMTISLSEKEAKAVAAEHPAACEEIWRNRKTFMGLRVDLSGVAARQVSALIEKSWRPSAPKRIVAAYDDRI
jgi:hypothetical protein